MKIPRILIVSIVFLVIWSESFSHQVRKRNNLLKRSRRNHELDPDLGRVKQTNNGKERKNGPIELVDPSNTLKAKDRTSNLNLGRYPVKGFVLPRRTITMRPLHSRNSKGIDNTHNPYDDIKKVYSLANNNNDHLLVDEKEENFVVNQINLNESILNQTSQVDEVEDKKPVVDEILDCNWENAENTVIQKFKKPQIIKLKKPKQEELKTKISYDIKKSHDYTNHDTSVVKQVHDKHLKNNKNNTLLTVKDTSTERDEMTCDADNPEDEKISVDVLIEKEQQSKSNLKCIKIEDMVVSHDNDELPQKKHPLFKAMQHDIDVNSPSPIELNVTDSTEKDNETANNNEAFDLDSVKKQLQTEANDDNEGGVIVKKKNINEFIEIARTPTVPLSYQQNNHVPAYYQMPYQKLTNSGLNDNGIWEANEQQVDQISGTNVASYNNYIPMLENNNYNRYYPYNSNNYRYYGYQGYDKPSNGNVWNYNCYSPNENVKDRVWRSWQNTEYFLKTKNALKQIGKEKLYNVVNQNNIADKTKNITWQNALEMNGYYRNQNNSPYI